MGFVMLRHTHAHRMECSTWTTNAVHKYGMRPVTSFLSVQTAGFAGHTHRTVYATCRCIADFPTAARSARQSTPATGQHTQTSFRAIRRHRPLASRHAISAAARARTILDASHRLIRLRCHDNCRRSVITRPGRAGPGRAGEHVARIRRSLSVVRWTPR